MAVTAAGWVVGGIVTALILWSPYVAIGYHSPSLHLVLDSVDACVALLCAYLVHGRFLRRRRVQDLLLSHGLVLLAVAGIGSTLATTLGVQQVGGLDVWLPMAVRGVGAVLITTAALSAGRHLRWRRSPRWVPVGLALLLAAVTAALWMQRARLPLALDPAQPPPMVGEPLIVGHPVFLATQAFTALCFAVASILFTVQAARRVDVLLRWLGPACALAAFARVNYLLFPSLYSDWLYTGDLLRTGFYLLLLVGATREIRQYWDAQAAAAVLEDRRRLARELHDGVIQELGFIRSESHAIVGDGGRAARIIAACDRALDETRGAVEAFGHAVDEPLGFVLHRAARQMAERYSVDLELDLDDSVAADPQQRHALVRITREALSNAVRHGRARRVRIQLVHDEERRRLSVEDDGSGFDVPGALAAGAGYGLTSMRERARALPGVVDLDSVPGQGTVVTVRW